MLLKIIIIHHKTNEFINCTTSKVKLMRNKVNLQKGNKKLINAWAFYDWANSVYPLVITSTVFRFIIVQFLMILTLLSLWVIILRIQH